MWLRLFPCPGTTELFSGEGQEGLVDGVSTGEVCSKSEQESLFRHFFLTPLSHQARMSRKRLGYRLDAAGLWVVCNYTLANEALVSCQLIFTSKPPAVRKNASKKLRVFKPIIFVPRQIVRRSPIQGS